MQRQQRSSRLTENTEAKEIYRPVISNCATSKTVVGPCAQFMSDDSFEMTDCLKTARSALDQNLIESNDYDQVKAAFLRAQQIRAGLDAGFIRQDDYDQIKQTFLQSLGGMSVGPSSAVQHHPQPLAGRGDEHPSAPSSAPATAPQASQSGRQTNRQPSFTQATPSTSHSHAPAPAAPSGPVTAGGAHIPADIPKMGGNRPKQPQGVSPVAFRD